MPITTPILNNFTSGEVSPLLYGRIDLEKYNQACKSLLNNIIHSQGGASKRFGTRYVAETKTSSKESRLIEFEFSTTQNYILEFGDQYIRFFMDNGQILGADVTVENSGFETLGTPTPPTILNAGFETAGAGGADVFGSWTESAGDGTITQDSSERHEGTNSCKLVSGPTSNTYVSQASITVVASTQYTLCFYTQGDGTHEGRFLVYDVSNGADIVALKATGISDADFAKVTETFTTPVGCTEIRIEFYCPSTNTAIAWFDQVWFLGLFDSWTDDQGDGSVTQETSLVAAGSAACKLTAGENGGTASMTQEITVTAANDYELRFYSCGDGNDEGRYAIYDVSNSAYIQTVTKTGNSDLEYEYVSLEFTTPAGCTTIRLEFYCPESTGYYTLFDAIILKDIESVYEIISAWEEDEIWNIRYVQDADTMYLVHPDVAPYKLTRSDHDLWTLTEIDWQDGPYLEEISDIDITPSGTTGSITLTAASPIFSSNHVGALFRWQADDTNWYWLKITAFTSRTVVTATVKGSDLPNTNASNPYRFGAWSPDQGYPRAIAFYEQRLILAATAEQPQWVFGSTSQDYENMAPGTDADDAWIYQIAAEKVNAILWMQPGRYLSLGTAGGPWIMNSGSEDQPISPTAIKARRDTTEPTYNLQAMQIGQSIVFLQSPGLQVRELTYRYLEDNYAADDLTVLSEHITRGSTAALSGIVDWTYQAHPDSIIWAVRKDGVLLGFTYDKLQEVFAWHRHITEGASGDHSFESVACISTSTHDQVWMIVNRTIDGSTARYVEYMEKRFFTQEECFFVDSGLSYESTKYDITGATAADPVVITCAGHPYSDGDYVFIEDVGGMTEINDKTFVVTNSAADTFELYDRNGNSIDGEAYSAYTSGGTARLRTDSFENLDHLEGETVQVLADGAAVASEVVSSGTITIDQPGSVVHVGLGYDSVIEPLPPEPGAPSGTSLGKTKRIIGLNILFHETLGGKVGTEDGDEDAIPFRKPSDPMGFPPALASEIKTISFPGGYEKSTPIRIVQDKPLPMTILAVVPMMDISED